MEFNLGFRIGELRERSGLSQAGLAKKLGISRSSVNAWEMGIAIPQLKHVVEMANIFSTTVDDMLNISTDAIINISDLSEKERKAVLSVVECLRVRHNSEN